MMMNMVKALVGIGFVTLAACGPLQEQNALAATVKGVLPSVMGGDSTEAEAVAPSPGLTREFLASQPTDFIRMSVIDRDATGLVPFGGRNGDTVTWMSAEGLSFSFRNGLLVGTRGLGDDLMGADVSGALASFSRGGNHTRTLDFMNGLDQIEQRRFQCATQRIRPDTITIVERTYATTVFEETCVGVSGEFKNTYWRDASGVIWQARQWISDGEGYIGYQRL